MNSPFWGIAYSLGEGGIFDAKRFFTSWLFKHTGFRFVSVPLPSSIGKRGKQSSLPKS